MPTKKKNEALQGALTNLRDEIIDMRDRMISKFIRVGELSASDIGRMRTVLGEYERSKDALGSTLAQYMRDAVEEAAKAFDDVVRGKGYEYIVPGADPAAIAQAREYDASKITTIVPDEKFLSDVRLAYLGQRTPGELIERIADRWNGVYWKAQSVAMTELGSMYNGAFRERQRETNDTAKQYGLLALSVWEHVGAQMRAKISALGSDEPLGAKYGKTKQGRGYAPRENHLLMHGVRANAENLFEFVTSDGSLLLIEGPYAPELDASDVVNCGCTLSTEIVDASEVPGAVTVKEEQATESAAAAPQVAQQAPAPQPTVQEAVEPVAAPRSSRPAEEKLTLGQELMRANLAMDRTVKANVTEEAIRTVCRRVAELRQEYKIFGLNELSYTAKQGTYASMRSESGGQSVFSFGSKFNKPKSMLRSLQSDVRSEWHPRDCNTIKSVIDHEIGHALTSHEFIKGSTIASKIRGVLREYNAELELHTKNKNTPDRQRVFISRYAGSNEREFAAEAFTMALNSANPSPYAVKVKEIIDEYFRNEKGKTGG